MILSGQFESLRNRVRQYGTIVSGMQFLRALVRRAYASQSNIVFALTDFSGHAFRDSCIKPLTGDRIARADESGELSADEVELLSGFVAEGSQGVCAEGDGTLMGYAWVQHGGEYRFGRAGRMTIPDGYCVAKNLLVFPAFRGRGLARKLNEARLALISGHTIPVVFIIPENRYAIRNWEQLGFERVAEVKEWRWFSGPWRMKVLRPVGLSHVEPVTRALEGARHA